MSVHRSYPDGYPTDPVTFGKIEERGDLNKRIADLVLELTRRMRRDYHPKIESSVVIMKSNPHPEYTSVFDVEIIPKGFPFLTLRFRLMGNVVDSLFITQYDETSAVSSSKEKEAKDTIILLLEDTVKEFRSRDIEDPEVQGNILSKIGYWAKNKSFKS